MLQYFKTDSIYDNPADPHKMNTVEEIFSISSSLTCVSWSSSASDEGDLLFFLKWGCLPYFDLLGCNNVTYQKLASYAVSNWLGMYVTLVVVVW